MSAQQEDPVTLLVNEVFVANGTLLEAGDALTASIGLTAAQWQVLGFLSDGPSTVARLARRRGLRRQSVQETMNTLSARELVTRSANPDDARAPLWRLRPEAVDRLTGLTDRRRAWAARIGAQLDASALEAVVATLAELTRVVRADTTATSATGTGATSATGTGVRSPG